MTDQEKSKSRLLEEERYRLLVETTNDLIWELDQNCVYTYVSPRVEELLGYDPEEMIGRTPFEFMPSEEAERIRAVLAEEAKRIRALFDEKTASGEGLEWLEVTMLHKDGRSLVHETNVSPFFDAVGMWCGFRGISRDITERKQAEETLRQNHEELQAIHDGMVDGLLIADRETKKFVRANHAICWMLGYSEEEMLSLSVMEIHPPDELADALAMFKARAEGRLAVENLPMLRKDGSVFYADVTANYLVYQGRPCNIGFFRDITERKHAEEALCNEHRVLNQLLKAQDREQRTIAYDIHDGLAQQLTAAIMQFQIFDRTKHQFSESAAKVCGTVQELLAQSLAETRRLISGVRPLILDEYGVMAAIQHLVYEITDQTNMKISLHGKVEFDRLEPVLENAIYRITQESLSNACRHSESDRVLIELVQHDEQVRIIVRDWGIGFDPQSVDEQCFGLAGIRERVRLLGGEVSIDTSPGEGSRIVVELPIALDEFDG